MFDIFFQASLLIKLVLLILTGLSVASWTIIVYKYLHLSSATKASRQMLETLHSSNGLKGVLAAARASDGGPLARIAQAAAPGAHGVSPDELRTQLRSYQAQEADQLESYLIFLATTGATSPFIGLLGTVWGIMDAFRGIGAAGTASLAVVAPAIAEALVATAAGLAVAIPSVMAYNFFLNWVRKLTVALEQFTEAVQQLVPASSR